MKIPYMLVVGEREEAEGSVSVRRHRKGDLGPRKVEDFIRLIQDEVREELGNIN